MDKPKKLILDYSKWRCGDDGPNALGTGKTELLNSDKFMCCLGIWSLQLGASMDELLHKGEPNEIDTLIPIFAEEEMHEDVAFNPATGQEEICVLSNGKITTHLATDCIGINDDKGTTPEQKILELKERLQKEGIELEVINKPDACQLPNNPPIEETGVTYFVGIKEAKIIRKDKDGDVQDISNE